MSQATAASATELVITRIVDAPRAAAYRAFVDPDQLAAWFGPVGFTVPRDTVDIDPRVGGHLRFTMVSDEDPAFTSPSNGTFTELVENAVFEGTEPVPGAEPAVLRLRVEFHDADAGGTRLELRQGPFPAEIAEMAREGWLSSFTKLDALLAR
ncbi:SRPBCC domain-containing protein [Frankia sp. CNm7]|uniref:SRPBCC domain-containing protein n=1 Tax=Frankia nepalensis TaxID=1836974 RepID=A0A937RR59_9ACTN|nr:SRPBCC domain-containing protein [Frankia nepalensis]MBL7499480.1 SRPBCC domain-containing protein [Frankia nepalensis]MBL7515365.1 SRPBCC domain-containing protein [Frankia nepalensis]MBL7523082.1 SRPBCC domain-containing protein [Frankia nepalensis]MBL7631854.1 SRPBCC domain-containing protein [Frankia nepalensis]